MSNAELRTSDSPDRTSDQTILEVDDLVKQFGGLTAVDHLSFDVYEGEILGFIGPNGAGKSTTFNCIFGSFPPTSGTVRFKGEDVTGYSAYKMVHRGMARTFQTFRPLEDRDVVSNVSLSMVSDKLFTLNGIFGQTEERAIELCERIGLEDDMYKMPDELTHAEMIRMELARALATDPELLLVDEPFAGLSDHEIEALSDLFMEFRDDGMTFIVVDHNMRGLLDLIDRSIVINFGELIADGTPREITQDPTVQKAYLGGETV